MFDRNTILPKYRNRNKTEIWKPKRPKPKPKQNRTFHSVFTLFLLLRYIKYYILYNAWKSRSQHYLLQMIFNVGKTSDSRFHRKSLTKSNNFWKFARKNSKKFGKCFGSPKRHFYRNTETPPKRPKRRFYRNLKPKPKFRSNTILCVTMS